MIKNEASKQEQLDKLRGEMEGAELPLKSGAGRLVFGDGNADADLMFIGEGPGYWEDQKGIPFVGNAGAFLNQLLALIGLERGDVFITNVVHYRPPENRDPTPEEMAAFQPYLDKMIEIIEPKIIVTLGRFSMGKFLPGARISGVHGKTKLVEWQGRKLTVVPMYHPAAGLRNGAVKEQTKQDFLAMGEVLKEGISIEDKSDESKKQDKVEQMSLI